LSIPASSNPAVPASRNRGVALATMRRDRLHARLGLGEHHDRVEVHVMAQEASTQDRPGDAGATTPASASYVEVKGLRTWHEVSGEGQVDGPLTYQVMADDTMAYLDGVVGGPAHLVGWSDGAVVALLVAQRHPELVDRLVLIGQYYNSSGKVAGGLVDQLRAGGDQAMGFLRAEYDPISPDGLEHFPVVYAKTLRMLTTEPELELSSLAAVTAPTLVLQGDRDEVTLEHGAALAARLPRGRFAVLPGTHALPLENPDVVNALLLWFLAGATPGVDHRRTTPSKEQSP
jgi:pimeloyl-ACP methyl ester carboxylesterase